MFLRRSGTGILALLAVAAVLATALRSGAVDPLTELVQWAVQRAVPTAVVEIGTARLEGISGLEVKDFVLRDPSSKKEILRLDRGNLRFSLNDLRQGRLGEVRLVNPLITANAGAAALFPGGSSGSSWMLDRLVCDYGEVHFDGAGPNAPLVRLKFSFDWKNFGDPGAKAAPLLLRLWDVQALAPGLPQPFLVLDRADITVSPEAMSRKEITNVHLDGGRLVIGEALQKMFSGQPDATAPDTAASNAATGWRAAAIDIDRVAVKIDDQRPGVSDISFVLNTEFRDLPLAQSAEALGSRLQSVELADLEVLSPYDPFTKVLTLRSLFLKFTLAGLLRKEIAELSILHPTIYVGEDLFWYMEDAQKRFGGVADPAASQKAPGWMIRSLVIDFGKLVVGSAGRVQYGLPLNFRTRARDVSLDNLASLQMQAALEIPSQTYDFESYQLTVKTEAGDLRFSYPPEEARKNLVGKIFIDQVRWRQYEAREAWVSATFDKEGINGEFGGRAYKGYVSGGFSFLFDAKSPWIGWLAGTRVDLERLTDIIAPKNFRLTGPLDFRLQMDAFATDIQRIKGDFVAPKPGTLTIGKIDDLLAEIPPTWPSLKSDSMRIALTALRDFEYTKAGGDLWFVSGQGKLDLGLQGPLGSRTFEVVLHADESQEGRWKNKR